MCHFQQINAIFGDTAPIRQCHVEKCQVSEVYKHEFFARHFPQQAFLATTLWDGSPTTSRRPPPACRAAHGPRGAAAAAPGAQEGGAAAALDGVGGGGCAAAGPKAVSDIDLLQRFRVSPLSLLECEMRRRMRRGRTAKLHASKIRL